MVDNIVLPGEIIYYIVVPVILASIPGLIMFIKRQELTGSKSAATEYTITGMRNDLLEMKSDVKELRKDQALLSNSVRDIAVLQEKVDKMEQKQDIQEDALRQIDNIKWRLANLEGGSKRGNGAI